MLGSFHQGDKPFGETAEALCACMALTALCQSGIRKASIWRASDLDYILESGDRVYKNLVYFLLMTYHQKYLLQILMFVSTNDAIDIVVVDFPYL